MAFILVTDIANAVANIVGAMNTFKDPQASPQEKYQGIVNSVSAAVTFVSQLATPNGQWMLNTGISVPLSQVNLGLSIGLTVEAVTKLDNDRSDANVNSVIQNVGGLIN